MDDKITLLSNNVWGIKNSHKTIKLFEYLQKNASPTGILYLQETHSSEKGEIRWKDEFKEQVFFLHETTSFCGIAIGYFGTKPFKVEDIKSDKMAIISMMQN